MGQLSNLFYNVAHDFTARMASGELLHFIKYASATVILLVSCAEAYLNEFVAIEGLGMPDHVNRRIKAVARAPLTERWLEIPRVLSNRTFDKGAEPFQSFHLLVHLRNHLVHYNARFRVPTEFPSKRVQSLATKFTFSYPKQADWTTQVLNLGCARWACRTVKAMVGKFHELVGGVNFTAWPEDWPDPP